MPPTIFEQSPTHCWQPDGGEKIFFPAKVVAESGSNRTVPRERLYRSGAKIDLTGDAADSFTTLSHFFNGTNEANVPRNPYPVQLNKLIAALKNKRGTLTLSTRGPIRAVAHAWQRRDSDERVDFATLQIDWIRDNGDSQTELSFTAPTARAAAVPLAAQVQAQLGRAGAWSDDVAALIELASALERALLLPSTYTDDAEQARAALQEATIRIQLSFANPDRVDDPTASLLFDPLGYGALQGLRELSEMTVRSKAEAAPGAAQPLPRRYPRPVSLAFVARDVAGQTLEDLLALNATLPDPRSIPAGTTILVRAA